MSRKSQPPQGGEPNAQTLEGEHPIAAAVERATGIRFRNPALAVRALTHSSFANESPTEIEDYERLEFLGDAVLDFLSAYWLFQHYPELPEGDLTRLRSSLVRTESLAAFARKIGLDRSVRIGKGERQAGGQNRNTILCGSFEALIGAAVLDQDIETAYHFLSPMFAAEAGRSFEPLVASDNKSLFQEKAQAKYGITPGYRVVEMSGPDHDRWYKVEVLIGNDAWGRGEGNSKQDAEQAAAHKALEKLEEMEKKAE